MVSSEYAANRTAVSPDLLTFDPRAYRAPSRLVHPDLTCHIKRAPMITPLMRELRDEVLDAVQPAEGGYRNCEPVASQ